MRWLDGITDSMDMNLGKFREMVRNGEAWRAAVHGIPKSWIPAQQQNTNSCTPRTARASQPYHSAVFLVVELGLQSELGWPVLIYNKACQGRKPATLFTQGRTGSVTAQMCPFVLPECSVCQNPEANGQRWYFEVSFDVRVLCLLVAVDVAVSKLHMQNFISFMGC